MNTQKISKKAMAYLTGGRNRLVKNGIYEASNEKGKVEFFVNGQKIPANRLNTVGFPSGEEVEWTEFVF